MAVIGLVYGRIVATQAFVNLVANVVAAKTEGVWTFILRVAGLTTLAAYAMQVFSLNMPTLPAEVACLRVSTCKGAGGEQVPS
jgi:hypothetical protein